MDGLPRRIWTWDVVKDDPMELWAKGYLLNKDGGLEWIRTEIRDFRAEDLGVTWWRTRKDVMDWWKSK